METVAPERATHRTIEEAMGGTVSRDGEELVTGRPVDSWSVMRAGASMQSKGALRRLWQRSGGQQVDMQRSSGGCPDVGTVMFLLAEQWELTDRDQMPHARTGSPGLFWEAGTFPV
jgi:hypothetical protein